MSDSTQSPLAPFAQWMDATALPYLTAFMGRHADTALIRWIPTPPDGQDLPCDVFFEHDDARVGHGLGPKPWHSAHTRLLLARHAPAFLPGFAAGRAALLDRLGRHDLTLSFCFDTIEGPMRASLTASCPPRRLFTNAAPFTTLHEMEAYVRTPLRSTTPIL